MIELKDIKGVGPATEKKLNELGIFSIFELFSLLPRKFLDLSTAQKVPDVEFNQTCLISGRVESVSEANRFGNKMFTIQFSDNLCNNKFKFKANIFNMPFLSKTIKVGDNYRLLTKFTENGVYVCSNPVMEKEDKISKLNGYFTIYPLKGIFGQSAYKNILYSSLDAVGTINNDSEINQVYRDIIKIFNRIHRPSSIEDAEKALVDLASIDLGVSLEIYRKSSNYAKKYRKVFYKIENNRINEYNSALKFNLTTSQLKAIDEINFDLSSKSNMSRIICGDVGSGKTAVAFYAMYLAAYSNHQTVMMAPTEILATQHYLNFKEIADKLNISFALLTSSTSRQDRENILKGLKNGSISCLFGTQSVLSDDVKYKDLTLGIIDEQHRFGVNDREKIEEKGAIDILSMTATPIPRSLALSFYENLTVSTIEKREEAKTNVFTSVVNNLDLALNTILALAMNKKQAFIVCPAIEDAEGNLIFSIEMFKEKYLDRFKKVNVEFMHGKMSQKEKDDVMNRFSKCELDVLVATSIIEVGIDTKASEMLIINADRFGLASIHQLRGRIGRNGDQAHCILYTNSISENAHKRLQTIVDSNDGQHISEVDFEMRGAGDFIGTKQSGSSLTPMFKINMNSKVLSNAKKYADARLKNISLINLLKFTHKSKDSVLEFLDEIKKVTLNS